MCAVHPVDVHLSSRPEGAALARLHAELLLEVRVTFGPDLPDPSVFHILVNGRPSPEQLAASPNLHTLIIPYTGLPPVTRAHLRAYPHVAVHNLHHNAPPTAEMALALLLAAAKLLVPSDRDFRRGDWTPRYEPFSSVLLAGRTALVLGYGAIGQRVGVACRALDMEVIGVRRHQINPTQAIYPPGALPSLLPRAQVVIICLPGTPATSKLLGASELALLPRGAILVNVGRADVVDQHALYDALANRHLHAAGLDVWYNYPASEEERQHTFPADAPFHELDNIVMSPHRAGSGGNPEIEELRMVALARLLNLAARGEPLPDRVDLDAGY